MELLGSIAIMGAALITLLIGACIALALWREGGSDSSPVLFEQVLRRQGDDVARRALASGSEEFALAVRQCLACQSAARCRTWLYSGARDGYQAFCPNAGFVHRIKLMAT